MAWHGMAWHEGASWYHAYGHQQNGLHESNIYLTQVAIYIIIMQSVSSDRSVLFSKSALLSIIR